MDTKPQKARPEDYIEDCISISEAFSEFSFWDKDQQKQYLDILQPIFFVGTEGITKISIPVSKNRNRTDTDTALADKHQSPQHIEINIKPPFWHLPKPTLNSLGLSKKSTYTPREVAMALGEHIDVMRKRLLAGIYPEPKLYKGKGHRRFTAREVLRMAEIKERIELGF